MLAPDGNNTQKQPATIDQTHFRQRPLQVAPPLMETALTPPVQFGTHARLLGYDLNHEDGALTVALHWEVLQTLLPPHHIFVHLVTSERAVLAQSDDIPTTNEGPAPTSTWRPNEYLTTHHRVAALQSLANVVLHVGLYIPETGARLPASRAGQPAGDAATLPVAR